MGPSRHVFAPVYTCKLSQQATDCIRLGLDWALWVWLELPSDLPGSVLQEMLGSSSSGSEGVSLLCSSLAQLWPLGLQLVRPHTSN